MKREVDTTRPFQPGTASTPSQPPGAASTPYHGGEEHEMTHLGPEQSGFDDTNPLLPQTDREKAWNEIRKRYPNASAIDLEAFYDPKWKRLKVKMAGAGKKAYYLETEKKGTGIQRLNPNLTYEITRALGTSAEEQLVQDRQVIMETNRRLKEARQLEKNIKRNSCKTTTSGSRKTSKRSPT